MQVCLLITPKLGWGSTLEEISKLEILVNNFYSVEVSGDLEYENGTWIKIHCPEARFTLFNRKDQIDTIYSNIFNRTFDGTKTVLNSQGYKVKSYRLRVLYQISQESPYILPILIPPPQLESLKQCVVDIDNIHPGKLTGRSGIICTPRKSLELNWASPPHAICPILNPYGDEKGITKFIGVI